MVIESRKFFPVLKRLMYRAFILCLLLIFFHKYVKITILPPIKKFVSEHMSSLVSLAFIVFLVCSTALIIILYLLARDNKRFKAFYKRYISKLISPDYYKETRRVAYENILGVKFDSEDYQRMHGDFDDDQGKIAREKISDGKDDPPGDRDNVGSGFTGVYKAFFKDGVLKKEAYYKDGQLNGPFKTYYEDGKIHQEKTYKEGLMHGVYKAYDPYGILYFEITYKNGQQDGIEKSYYKTGILQYMYTYRDGEMINRKTYDEGGKLKFDHDFYIPPRQ